MGQRLATELALLYRVEAAYKIPAAPITRQLIEWEQQPLPDVLPVKPAWVEFQWPASGVIDLSPHWRSVDRERGKGWSGPYL